MYKPMQKNSTPLKKSALLSENQNNYALQNMQPQKATLQKIIQFASAYKALKTSDNQYVDLILN